MNDIQAKPSHDRNAGEINLLSPLTLREVTCAIGSPCRPCANIPRRKASPMTGISCISAAAQQAARLSSWSRRPPSPAMAASRPAIWESGAMRISSPSPASHASSRAKAPCPAFRSPIRRKASCDVPWRGGRRLTESEGGWPVIAPSAIPFNPTDPAPIALDQAGIDGIVAEFRGRGRPRARSGI